MSRPRVVPGLLAALLMIVPLAWAQAGVAPPAGADRLMGESFELAHWVGGATEVDDRLPGEGAATLWFALSPVQDATGPGGDNATAGDDANATADDANATADGPNATAPEARTLVAVVDLAGEGLSFEPSRLTVTLPNATGAWEFANATVTAAGAGPGAAEFSFNVTLHEGSAEGPVVESLAGAGSVTVATIEVPPPPGGLPTAVLVGGAAVLVLAGGAGAYAMKQRRERRTIQRAPRRSQALREEQIERQVTKRPEQAAVVQQEIRQQEKVRETRREMQILEAKRADALKTIDLLKKRHEAGGLTKLQYEGMVAKKQADLQRIEAEIAEMDREGGGPGAAA